jgi:hypothetical protein
LEDARAIDLTGALATHGDECSRVFAKKGRASQVGFTALSERYGSGFIIESNRLRDKFANCRIKTRKDDGQTLNILASCANDIMLSNVQFGLKVLDQDRIVRLFPAWRVWRSVMNVARPEPHKRPNEPSL